MSRNHPPKQCNKIGYVSRGQARKALKVHDKAGRRAGGQGGLKVYRCHVLDCPYWHLGRSSKTRRG